MVRLAVLLLASCLPLPVPPSDVDWCRAGHIQTIEERRALCGDIFAPPDGGP